MRDALEMKHVISASVKVTELAGALSYEGTPYVTPACSIHSAFLSARQGSCPYIKKNGNFQPTADWGGLGMDESISLIVKVKAFFLFTQVNKQKIGLKYIRVQFHENRDFCFIPCCVLGT